MGYIVDLGLHWHNDQQKVKGYCHRQTSSGTWFHGMKVTSSDMSIILSQLWLAVRVWIEPIFEPLKAQIREQMSGP